MTKVAVIAHAGKSFDGGLPQLRRELERQGVDDPLWVEIAKSRFAAKQVERVLDEAGVEPEQEDGESDEKLAVFREFVNSLDVDLESGESPPPEEQS